MQQRIYTHGTLLFLVLLVTIFHLSHAQRPLLKAFVRFCRDSQAPFSFVPSYTNSTCTGYLVELFEHVARIMNVDVAYIPQNSTYTLSAVQTSYSNSVADVALGFTSITDERSLLSDFSIPYLTTGYRFYMIKTMLKTNANFFDILINPSVVLVISLLFLLIVVSTVIMWIFEIIFGAGRGVTFSKGLYEFLVATIGLVMTGEHTYDSSSKMVKLIICVGWIVGVVLSDLFTGLITANLAVAAILKGIKGPEDMIGRRVGVVQGSNLVSVLQRYNMQVVPVSDMQIAYNDFTNGNPLNLDALADLSPVLYYLFGENGANQGYFSAQFSDLTAGLAVPKESPYLRNISEALLSLRQDGTLDRLYTAWIEQPNAVENAQDVDVDPNYSKAAFGVAIIILIFILTVFLLSSLYYVIRKIVKFRRLVAMNHAELQGKPNWKLMVTLFLEIIGIKKLEVKESEELTQRIEQMQQQVNESQYNKAQLQYLNMVKNRSPTIVTVPPQLDEVPLEEKSNSLPGQELNTNNNNMLVTSPIDSTKTILFDNEMYEIAPEMSFLLETFVKTYCKKVTLNAVESTTALLTHHASLLLPPQQTATSTQEENDLPFRTSVDLTKRSSGRKSFDKFKSSVSHKENEESMQSLIRDNNTPQEEGTVVSPIDSAMVTLDIRNIQDE